MGTTTLLFWVVGVSAALIALAVWYFTRRSSGDEVLQHCRCDRCGQKLRFRASREGRTGQCPRCGHDLVLVAHGVEKSQPALRVGQPLRGGAISSKVLR
jgi:uncharacterized paraquat-inducible protein A